MIRRRERIRQQGESQRSRVAPMLISRRDRDQAGTASRVKSDVAGEGDRNWGMSKEKGDDR